MIKWSRTEGYECSSKGDIRFSAFGATLPDGRTIEQHYQCDVKGYDPGGTNWRLGKGKPTLCKDQDNWSEYLNLWKEWGELNEDLIEESHHIVAGYDNTLRDTFGWTPINQARALAIILNEKYK